MGKNKLTPEQQRKAQIKSLQGQIETMKRESKQKAQIKAEKEQIKQLRRQLHPSKFARLTKLLGKAEHGGAEVAKAFVKAGKEVKKADKEFQKLKKEM